MKRRILLVLTPLALVFFQHHALSQQVVISEVYGGGGNGGSLYKNDFIELYNPTNAPVDLTGWSVQYFSSTGTAAWSGKTNLTGSIPAKGYYLIQEAIGAGGTLNLPTPDATGTIAMSATAGKVALVSNTTTLNACPTGLVDLVGFGTSNCFEGGGPTVATTNPTSVERKANVSSTTATMSSGGGDEFAGNSYDTDNNNNDFVLRNTPGPQNTASSLEPDNTAPSFTSSYPTSDAITESGFDLIVNLNEPGKVYHVVVLDGETAPSSAEVKAGFGNGGSTPSASGSVTVATASTNVPKTIIGLLASTSYDVYSVAEDVPGNLQSSPVKIDVTTLASTSPTLSPSTNSVPFPGFTDKSKQSPSQSFTMTASNLTADVNISVTGNFLISTDNANYSAAASINQALFAGNASQTVYAKFNPSGSMGIQAGTVTISSTGASNKTVTLSATAIDPFNQDFNDPQFLTNSGWMQYSKVGAQLWATTNFGQTCLTGCTNATVDKAAQINGFSGTSQNNEDWLISPSLDLTGFANFPALSFWTISAFAGDGLQLKYSTNYPGSGDPTLSTWTTVDGKFPAANSSLWTKSSDIILPKSQLFVAVVYTSNTTAASRWTFDNWKVEDVSSFLDVPAISFAFGEVAAGSQSASQNFTFTASGYGDITVAAPAGYEVSADNTTFSASVVVLEAAALAGKTVYVRFAPPTQQLKWDGAISFQGTALNASYGTLTGSSYPKSETFDLTTWNMEFFGSNLPDGSGEFGPVDDALQVANATTVMATLGSDIFAVEEISDDNSFNTLVAGLPGYDKVLSNSYSHSLDVVPDPSFPPQKVGFVFNTSTVQLVSARPMFKKLYDDILSGDYVLSGYPGGSGDSFWSSGRLPFMATFDITINGIKKRVRIIDIHGKSGATASDFNRRVFDAQVLRDSLSAQYANENIILLGDFNDDVDMSIYTGSTISSYNAIVVDVNNFNVLTYPLSLTGASSFPSSSSLIDHIVISNEMTPSYVSNSTIIEDPRTFISNYSNTTSDHLPVSARFLLVKTDQNITFAALPTKILGDADFNLTATTSSNLPVTFTSSDPLTASISGNTVTILKAGTVDITASQTGDTEFNAANNVVRQLVINKIDQTILFGALTPVTYGDAPFNLSAITTSSLPPTFVSSDPAIATISGPNNNLVTILKAGTINITASQEGDAEFNAAPNVVQQLVINKANQTITFGTLSPVTFGVSPFSLTATSTSGLTVTFASSAPAVATISGNTVTVVGGGSTTITALQAGDDNYNEAVSVQQALEVNKVNQTITFGALADKAMGDAPFALTASSTSALAVAFAATSDKVTISGSQVTIVKAGRATITASQAGNATYNAAPPVDRSFCIKPAKPTITISNANTESPTLTSSASAGNQWYLNGNAINGATGATLNVTGPGAYKVQVKVDDCVSDFSNDTAIIITGDLRSNVSIITYPNPAETFIEVRGIVGEVINTQVVDMTGRVSPIVLEKRDEVHRGNVENLSVGIYLLRIQQESKVHQVKFIKK